jgi:arabinose-5-phosphate isomerase
MTEAETPLPIDAAAVARRTVRTESEGLERLAAALENGQPLALELEKAVRAMLHSSGRVIVTGMGKSGHIGRKIAATLASTGQPATYVHPGEASHGDLGMIEERDVVLALSNSGETPELADVLGYTHRFGIPLIALTSKEESTLAKAATIRLVAPKVEEACKQTSAPTSSTTVALALGDALAVALLEARGFTSTDFKTFHPGGKLGAQLRKVGDLLPDGRTPPVITLGTSVLDAIRVMSEAGFGCVGVVGENGTLKGIITDGDLRRHASELGSATVEEVMTPDPRTVSRATMAGDALSYLTEKRITALFVVEDGTPVSLLHVHDLLTQGVL